MMILMALGGAACGGGTEPVEELGTIPAQLRRVSGHSQWAKPRETIERLLVAEVVDAAARPVPGTPVTWTATTGARFLSRDNRTDIGGRVTAQVELGPQLGTYVVAVRVTADTTLSTRFSLYATVDGEAPIGPPPAAIIMVADNGFTPADVTVRVREGVQWVWQNSLEAHDIVFEPPEAVSPAVGNTFAKKSGTYTGVMNYVGTIDYYCSVHAGAHGGTITVTN